MLIEHLQKDTEGTSNSLLLRPTAMRLEAQARRRFILCTLSFNSVWILFLKMCFLQSRLAEQYYY